MLTDEQILDAIAEMDAPRIVGLVRAMEQRFGVSSSAPVVAYPDGPAAERKPGPSLVDVVLERPGGRIATIRMLRRVAPVGMRAAREMADAVPCTVASGIGRDEAEGIIGMLEGIGAECRAEPCGREERRR